MTLIKEKVVRNRKNLIISGLMLVIVVVYVLSNFFEYAIDNKIEGRPLAYYDFYPVVVKENGNIGLDESKLNDAIEILSTNKDKKASSDLIRLIEQNSASFLIREENNKKIQELKEVTHDPTQDNSELFLTIKNIVHGFGQTLEGTPIEILVHDTRNPLKSVVAIENSITGRNLYDRNTNFGIELIKRYARNEIKNGSIIAYPIKTEDGRVIKATTIPIYDRNNLIALICINIDTSKINSRNENEVQKFIDSVIMISAESEYEDIKEFLPIFKQEKKYMALDRMRYELEKPLLLIKEKKGILACAYINPETCNKTGEACAIVSGVNNYEDMMSAKVIMLSEKAKKLGIKVGDLGSEALEKMK